MTRTTARLAWTLLLLALLASRVPSLVEPAGSDQGIYGYDGQRVLAGGALYRDAWDQKPPAIAVIYAAGWRMWPHESLVPTMDLAAAAGVAALLVLIGRRRFSEHAGFAAGAIFLLLGDPSLHGLSGIAVRGQCETFIALAITAALALLSGAVRRHWHLVAAGVCLAAAFWLKYNAIAFALPIALAAWAWRDGNARARRTVDLASLTAGFALVTVPLLAWIAAQGAPHDLWLATVSYNLHYSEETYQNRSTLTYVLTFPAERAKVDLLWFLGGIGSLVLFGRARIDSSARVALAWLAAAVLSIAINGARNLPQYFVQANPALALCGAAGLAAAISTPGWIRYAVALACCAGLWRVGADDVRIAGLRLGGLPNAVANIRWDLAELRGRLDRQTYLRAFSNPQKYDALEIDTLSHYVDEVTTPADPIYVFGFSGGSVCWKSQRVSASRFSWSRPVLIEFAADEPGYGSAGLLSDLERRPPALVALQKESQWRSAEFFMSNPPLRTWLESGYTLDHETPMFAVWRRKS